MTSTRSRNREIYKVTLVGSAVNLALALAKFAAGVLGRSAAMIADAVHTLSDLATDIVILAFVRVSGKPRDEKHRYGHGKFETLATLIIGVVLLVVGVMIAYGGAERVVTAIKGEVLERPGMIAFWAALATIVFKEALYRYTVVRGRRLKSDVTVANAWHHRSDGLSSIGTAIGIGGAIFLGPRWAVLDPLAAVVVSVFIVRVAVKLMKPAMDELMEKSLPEDVEREICETVGSFDGVSELHNLCTRKIGASYAIEFHIRMDGSSTLEETHSKISQIEYALRAKYGPQTHVMIHIEPVKKKL
ncbi:MAG: cation diffusion facilitator family transporter [Rikenellaceae bacterium]|nr:cation diffusion facilitator family transporter [Rikenellaceae bacterium]MCL2693311.1 cation diffusion facilitator family transporter [Rikenellaceae bacterium]